MSWKSCVNCPINCGIISEITAEHSEVNSGEEKEARPFTAIAISAYRCKDGNDPDWVKTRASENPLSRIAGEGGRSAATGRVRVPAAERPSPSHACGAGPSLSRNAGEGLIATAASALRSS